MSQAWPQLDELIRELGDVCALPNAEEEPALSAATIAVTKATTALAHAAQARGRAVPGAVSRAGAAVEEARAALRQARDAIKASPARHGSGRRPTPPAPTFEEAVSGEVEATCPACRRPFVVRYRALGDGPLVAFPIACPSEDCDGVADVEYPASAVEVVVGPGEEG